MWASGQKTVGKKGFEEHCIARGCSKGTTDTGELHCIVEVLMVSSERAKRKRNRTNMVHRLNIAKASEAGDSKMARDRE